MATVAAAAVVAAVASSAPVIAAHAQLPTSHLAVRVDGEEARPFWRSASSPSRWAGPDPVLRDAIGWRAVGAGVSFGEVPLTGTGEAARVRLVVVRIAPQALRARLLPARQHPARWTIDSAPPSAVVAINAGQFTAAGAWGWQLRDGFERQRPGRGPLSAALGWRANGAPVWLSVTDTSPPWAARGIRTGFQSYPTLLTVDGHVPDVLQRETSLVDVAHRDARLAAGLDRGDTLWIALTRFDGLGPWLRDVAGRLPFGLTTPEMAAVMGALGCRVAVALDGGASAQLLVRDAAGVVHRWPGLREVPVGLVFEARAVP